MVMRVYTFSTGGCRDAIYLDRLVGNKDKVKDFVNKMTLLRDEISLFIEHLKTVKDE